MHPRIEDKPTIASFVEALLEADLPAFQAKFTKYLDPFATDYKNIIIFCKGIVATRFYVVQIKTLTKLMMTTAFSIRGDLDDIELMAQNAGNNLNMSWKDMGFKEVRSSLSDENLEGMAEAWTVLHSNITANDTPLTHEGLKPAQLNGLIAKLEQVDQMNVQQFKMKADKATAVAENHAKFDEMWNLTSNIVRAGKTIFRFTNPTRAKAYNLSKMLQDVRHDGSTAEEVAQKKAELEAANMGELSLTAKDFGIDDSWIEAAEVEIQGTEYKLETDEDGNIVVNLAAGTYNVIVRMDTYEDQVLTAVIKAGETTEMVVELKALPV
jgi:hypothetical protein